MITNIKRFPVAPNPRRLSQPFFRFAEELKHHRPNGMTNSLEAAVELAEKLRNFECVYYGDCLYLAAKAAWQGFACDKCKRRMLSEKDPRNVREKTE